MCIISFLLLCHISLMMYSCFSFRTKNIFYNIGIFLCTYLFTTLMLMNGISIFSMIGVIIFYCAYIYMMFQRNKKQAYVLGIPILIVGIAYAIQYSLRITNQLEMTQEQIYLIQLSILLGASIAMLLIFVCFMKLAKQNILNRFTVLIMIACIFPMFFIFEVSCVQTQLCHNNINMYISIMGILISNYFILYILYKIYMFSNTKDELQLSKNREESLMMKYTSMKQHYQNQFEFIHRLLHQCNVINSYMEKQEYGNVDKELHSLYEDTFTQFNLLYSNSVILNYMIAEKMDLIKENNICIRTTIEHNDFHFLTLAQQTELFELLLQYAIEEVKKIKEQRIIIWKTKKRNNQILLQCSFSSNPAKIDQTLCENIIRIIDPVKVQPFISYDEDTCLYKILIVFSL